MSLTFDEIFSSPDHYLHSFDDDQCVFVPMNRAAYCRSIFLDGRIAPAGDGQMVLSVGALASRLPPPVPTSWIFHVAHCGSTLLARALDRPSGNLVLREPLALRQASVRSDETLTRLAAAMASKRYDSALPTVVKANVPVNFVLPQLLREGLSPKALMLYLDLKGYILAILRDARHREWLRGVTRQLSSRLGDLSGLPDAECAAALWLAQMRAFSDAIDSTPNARSLDAERFFAEPEITLRNVSGLLGVPMSASEARAIANGPLFTTYSKNPEIAFDNRARVERRTELERSLEPDIDAARRWLDRQSDEAPARVAAAAL